MSLDGRLEYLHYNYYYNSGTGTSRENMSPEYFQEAYQNSSVEEDILSHYELYSNDSFVNYARTLPHYNESILELQDRIKHDKKFRKNTEAVPGFKYSYLFGKVKSGFHDFVNNEADRINKAQDNFNQNQQNVPRLYFDNREGVAKFAAHCKKQAQAAYSSGYNDVGARLAARIKAIEQTHKQKGKCSDYSSQVKHPRFTDPCANVFNNCYGTRLDKQLHEELCQTRTTIMDLQSSYANNIHVKAFAPIIYLSTAQAKTEQDAVKAFSLSDFSYDLVRIVKGSVNLMTHGALGIASGVKIVLSPQHWQKMGLGFLKLTVLLADEYSRQESLDKAFVSTIISGKPDIFLEKSRSYEEHHHKIAQGLKLEIKNVSEQIKKMPWEEFAYKGFKHGTIFILDGVVLNAAALVTSSAGRTFVSRVADVLNSPKAEEFVLEAAGVGKITLEEGADIANMAIEIIEKNPEIIQAEGSVIGAARRAVNLANENGKAFEEFLVKKFGGTGSFKVKNREFDGAIGNVWYEAKSGEAWNTILSNGKKLEKFKERMGTGLKIANENGAKYELYSNTPIPQEIKDWLTKKCIPFKEFLEGK